MVRISLLCFLALVTHLYGQDAGAPAAAESTGEFGEFVRLSRGETLRFENKNLAPAGKGQEFTVAKRAPGAVFLRYLSDEGQWIAVSVPSDAAEPATPQPWQDLINAAVAFREQRYEVTRSLLARAAQDKDEQALASALAVRLNAAVNAAGAARDPAGQQALVNSAATLRTTAEQLARAGRISLAAAIDQGIDRLARATLGNRTPPSKIELPDLARRAATAERAYIGARQAAGARRLITAQRLLREGLAAEASHPGLKALLPTVKRGVQEAEELYETANKMRRFEKGAIHALSAIDDGLKLCADHPRLRALRTEMSAQFEERTSPRVTSGFLSVAKTNAPRERLEEGRRLYTSRCAECHELEMLDNRSVDGWDRAVASMARRASLDGAQKAQIMEYLAAAVKVVEATTP